MEKDYSVKVSYSNVELTAKERIMLKDTADAISIPEATENGALVITPAKWVELDVHNEKAENKDYKVYLIIDADGNKYLTSSQSFWKSFIDITEEMEDVEEPYQIKIFQKPSNNYKGKFFLTCSVI